MTTTYKFRWKGNWDEVQADDRSRAVQKVIKKIGLPLRQGLRAMADNQLLVVRADLMGGLTESINEKSVSQNQQKLMGMAYALKKGEMASSEASQEVKDLAKSMTLQQLKDFAGTKHKGLPQKKGQMEMKLTESKLRQIIRSVIREESVNEDTKKRFEVDFYKGNGDRQTSHEEIIRGDKFSDVISQATKVAKSKGMNYVEFYYKDAFIGSIDRRNGYEFKKGRNSEKSPLSVNEANIGDKMKHKHIDGVSIELLDTTNKGWKVKQTGDGTSKGKNKTKIAYYNSIDITGGDKALFVKESVNEESYKIAGRPVTLNKGKKSNGTDWTVTFNNGKTVSLSDVLALIKPFPKGITKESVNESDAFILYRLSGNQVGTGTASEFLSKHKVDLRKLKKAKMQGVINSYDIRDIVTGKAHSLITKNFFKNYVKESVNENFIPGVGSIDDFMLKDMLMKNSKVNAMLDAKSKAFIKKPEVVVIMHQSKRFNNIFTDGKMELEIDTKSNKVVKPLGKARKAIADYFKNN